MNFNIASQQHSYVSGRNVRPIKNFTLDKKLNTEGIKWLRKAGIVFSEDAILKMNELYNQGKYGTRKGSAMDALQPLVTTGSMSFPIQFYQNWLPGYVQVITAKRNIDGFIGISTIGNWTDAMIVQETLELTGVGQVYGDYTNVPLASWSNNFVYRNVVRFEMGMEVGILEEAQAARIDLSSAVNKRKASALQLEIVRNQIGFYGFNAGNNLTYGFLNDPGLPAYQNVPPGAGSSTLWANKTYLEIINDILVAVATLQLQSQDNINPNEINMTLALPTASVAYLAKVSEFGNSVWVWLKETYGNRIRVVSAPELDAANGGANVFYLYADIIEDGSTDGGQTFLQNVPARFMMLGVQQLVKSYLEDYVIATAGTMNKRPWAVTRWSGI